MHLKIPIKEYKLKRQRKGFQSSKRSNKSSKAENNQLSRTQNKISKSHNKKSINKKKKINYQIKFLKKTNMKTWANNRFVIRTKQTRRICRPFLFLSGKSSTLTLESWQENSTTKLHCGNG
jgi:hypothetical protein